MDRIGGSLERVVGIFQRAAVHLYDCKDDNLKPIPYDDAIAPLSGRYVGDLEAIRKKIEAVKNQTK